MVKEDENGNNNVVKKVKKEIKEIEETTKIEEEKN